MLKVADGEGAGLPRFQEFLKSELNELHDRIMAELSFPSGHAAGFAAGSSAGGVAGGDAERGPGLAKQPCPSSDSQVPLERKPRDVPASPGRAIVAVGAGISPKSGFIDDPVCPTISPRVYIDNSRFSGSRSVSPINSNKETQRIEVSEGSMKRVSSHPSGERSLLERRGATMNSIASYALESVDTCEDQAENSDMHAFRLLDLWQDELDKQRKMELATPRRNRSVGDARSYTAPSEDRKTRLIQEGPAALTKCEEHCSRCLQSFVQEPNCRFRLGWDLIGMLLIGFDLVTIPLQIFMLPDTETTIRLHWFLRVFWTVDIPMSFMVGFHKAGVLIMSPARIAKQYCRTWFALDVFLVGMEWFLVAMEQQEPGEDAMESVGLARLGKTIRVMRILRILRLLRLIKLPRYFGLLEEHVQSEYVSVLIGIAKLTTCILIINHLVACCWYGVGVYWVPDNESGWVERFGLTNATVEYRYFTSMHWSLTQFTPASMEITPTNVHERAFDVCVVVFALVTFSSFVSSITTAMTKLRNMNGEYERLFGVLRLFMRRHKISTSLMVRMRRHLQYRMLRGQREIEEKDVQLLGLLSDPLRMELHCEMYSPLLCAHPFFHSVSSYSYSSMRQICHVAITETTLSRGDILFTTGDHCERMYFSRCGLLHYVMPSGMVQVREPEQLIPGEWLSEAVLWAAWSHLGDAQAFSTTTIVAVNAEKFREVVRRSRTLAPRVAFYAASFVRYLNEADYAGTLSDLTCATFNVDAALEMAFVLSEEGDGTLEVHHKPSVSLTTSDLLTHGVHGTVPGSLQHRFANGFNGLRAAC